MMLEKDSAKWSTLLFMVSPIYGTLETPKFPFTGLIDL